LKKDAGLISRKEEKAKKQMETRKKRRTFSLKFFKRKEKTKQTHRSS